MPQAQRSKRSRSYVFTINNPSDNREDEVKRALEGVSQYFIIGRERGASGTQHLQGYAYFKHPKSFTAVVELLGEPRAHVEEAKGTALQNQQYCSKDGDYVEFGDLPRQGRRKDLETIREAITEGASEKQIADSHFSTWVVYRRSLNEYRHLVKQQPRRQKSIVVWICGPTGSGKTRSVYSNPNSLLGLLTNIREDEKWQRLVANLSSMDSESARSRDLWPLPDASCRWFDGYDQQSEVLMDDFRGESDLAFMLRLLDRYPMQVPIKGGFVNWNPDVIYITSNFSPRDAYKSQTLEELRPFFRRIDLLVEKPTLESEFQDCTQNIRL